MQPPQPEGVYAFTQNRKNWKPSEGSARYRLLPYTPSGARPPSFYATFDAPAANVTRTRRAVLLAFQALGLANDPLVVELAAAGARIVLDATTVP